MRSNAWTTLEEFTFLEDLVPQFVSQQKVRVVGPWLAEKAAAFFAKFPLRSAEFDRDRLTKKLRTWFGNHTRDLVKGTDARHVLDLSGRANRRPLPLQPSQAYSALYYRQGSSIYKEIKNLYALYKSGDTATLSALQGLFEKTLDDEPDATTLPSPPNPESHPDETPTPPKTTRRRKKADTTATPQPDDPLATPPKKTKRKSKSKKATTGTDSALYVPPFVHFQQTIIREKLKTMSEEEAAEVERHIEDVYANAMKVWEQPWLAPAKSGKSGDNQENEFYVNNANRVGHSLQVAGEEVTRQTMFRTFFLWGGPTSVPGTIEILSADTGRTLEGGQDFPSFLGPMRQELEDKFGQWIKLTYTHEQLHRAAKMPSQPSDSPADPTPSQPGAASVLNPTSTIQPSSSPSDSTLPGPIGLAVATSDPTAMDHDIMGSGYNAFNADSDTFDADPDTFDADPDNFDTNPGAVINPRAATPAHITNSTTDNIISSTTASVIGSTTANPSIVNPIPTVADPSATTPTTADLNVTTPTATNLGVVIPIDTTSPTATNPTVDSPTTTGSNVVGSATADPNTSPTVVTPSAPSPAVAYSEVTVPTTSTPSLMVTAATPSSFDHGSSGQDARLPKKSAPGTTYPKFITPEVITHLSSITNVDGWSDLVQVYLEFEAASPSKSTTRLPAKGRPTEVDGWLKDTANLHVSIADAAIYIKAWTDWWTTCQPTGRAAVSWPFSHDPLSSTQLGRLLNGGKHGIFLFVMALSWWAKSIDSVASPPSLTGAVADVGWVLHQLVDAQTPPPTPAPTTGAAPDVSDTGRGKRKIVLTEKALNLDESAQKRYRR